METYDPKDSYFKNFKPEKSLSRKIADTATKAINAIPEPVKDITESAVKNAPKVVKGAGQVGGAFGTGFMLGDVADYGMEKATGYGMQDRYTDIASRYLLGQEQQYGEGTSAMTAFDAMQQGVDRDIARIERLDHVAPCLAHVAGHELPLGPQIEPLKPLSFAQTPLGVDTFAKRSTVELDGLEETLLARLVITFALGCQLGFGLTYALLLVGQ